MVAARLYRHDPSLVDDLAQEASIRLLRMARSEDIRSVEAAMKHVVRLVIIDHIRKRDPCATALPLEDHGDGALAAPARLMGRAASTILRAFEHGGLTQCCDRTRDVLDGLTWSEVARRDNRTETAVRKEWSRCVSALRDVIGDGGALLGEWG